MATPGYPGQMGQMPPMGWPPMGGPPMMGGPAGPQTGQRPIRRGTSKAVPVVVSAGLAVGVFCGLLFGVGTGKSEAKAAPPSASNVKKDDDKASADKAAPEGLGATSSQPVKPAAGSGTTVAATTPTPTPPTPTPPTPSVPDVKKMKLTIKIKPDAAAEGATVKIDGTEITGMTTEIPLDKKTVKVEVKSNGYRSGEKKLDVTEGDITLEMELSKRPSGNSGGVRPPKRPDRPPSNSGGGLIDI